MLPWNRLAHAALYAGTLRGLALAFNAALLTGLPAHLRAPPLSMVFYRPKFLP
jgi:hypothetical protein